MYFSPLYKPSHYTVNINFISAEVEVNVRTFKLLIVLYWFPPLPKTYFKKKLNECSCTTEEFKDKLIFFFVVYHLVLFISDEKLYSHFLLHSLLYFAN